MRNRGGGVRPIKRRSDIRPAGLLYVGTTVFVAVGAFNSQNNLLFWVFGLGVAGMLLSGLLSGPALMAIEVDRDMPEDGEAGGAFEIRYRVTNRSRFFPAFGMVIGEIQSKQHEGPGWRDHVSESFACVSHLGPGQSVWATARAEAIRRGPCEFNQLGVSSCFPFGLLRKSLVFEQPRRVLIRPRSLAVRTTSLPSTRGVSQVTTASTSRLGAGDEFFGVREYLSGDSPRLIAWRRSATSDSLIVRQNASPSPPKLVIEIERPDDGVPDHVFERGLALAASLAETLSRRRFAVGLEAPWAGIVRQPGSGARISHRIGQDLAVVERPGSDSDSGASVPRRGRRGRATLVVGFGTVAGSADRGSTRLSADEPNAWLEPGTELPADLAGPATERGRGTVWGRIGHALAVFFGMEAVP